MNKLAQTIIQARTAITLNQKELASQLDISAQYLSDIEHGNRQPPLELLQRISETLSIDIDVLCFYAGILPPDIEIEACCVSQITEAFKAFRETLASIDPHFDEAMATLDWLIELNSEKEDREA